MPTTIVFSESSLKRTLIVHKRPLTRSFIDNVNIPYPTTILIRKGPIRRISLSAGYSPIPLEARTLLGEEGLTRLSSKSGRMVLDLARLWGFIAKLREDLETLSIQEAQEKYRRIDISKKLRTVRIEAEYNEPINHKIWVGFYNGSETYLIDFQLAIEDITALDVKWTPDTIGYIRVSINDYLSKAPALRITPPPTWLRPGRLNIHIQPSEALAKILEKYEPLESTRRGNLAPIPVLPEEKAIATYKHVLVNFKPEHMRGFIVYQRRFYGIEPRIAEVDVFHGTSCTVRGERGALEVTCPGEQTIPINYKLFRKLFELARSTHYENPALQEIDLESAYETPELKALILTFNATKMNIILPKKKKYAALEMRTPRVPIPVRISGPLNASISNILENIRREKTLRNLTELVKRLSKITGMEKNLI